MAERWRLKRIHFRGFRCDKKNPVIYSEFHNNTQVCSANSRLAVAVHIVVLVGAVHNNVRVVLDGRDGHPDTAVGFLLRCVS